MDNETVDTSIKTESPKTNDDSIVNIGDKSVKLESTDLTELKGHHSSDSDTGAGISDSEKQITPAELLKQKILGDGDTGRGKKLTPAELLKQKVWETMKDEPKPVRSVPAAKEKPKIKTPAEVAAELNVEVEEVALQNVVPAEPYYKRFLPTEPDSLPADIDEEIFEGSPWLKNLYTREVQIREVPAPIEYQITGRVPSPSSSPSPPPSSKPSRGRKSRRGI